MTVRSDLDQLIDWYLKHSPAAGRVIPVIAAPNTIRKFARKIRRGPFIYRSCEIVPIRRVRNGSKEFACNNKQTELLS